MRGRSARTRGRPSGSRTATAARGETRRGPGHAPLLALLGLPGPALAAIVTATDPATGLRSWEWRERGVSIRLVQRLPDQSRGFFQARGFAPPTADRIARACMFQTVFRNDGTQPVAYDLGDWRVHAGASRLRLRTREAWHREWPEGGVSEASRIALHWALLPSVQRFAPGDYNWGMTSFGLEPGRSFDLSLVLQIGVRTVRAQIPGVVCAADA